MENLVRQECGQLRGSRVLVTGHTGFKGSWLSLVLRELDVEVHGFALGPKSDRDLFVAADIGPRVSSSFGDIRDIELCRSIFSAIRPDIVFHLAAQPLVRESYVNPLETLATNVIGTANILEAARQTSSVRAVINVTSDKCYDNIGTIWPYRETDPLGGSDPYSCSKGCSELITSAWERSFYKSAGIRLCSVRAGNVLGAGDWSEDRIVPDFFRAFERGTRLILRKPGAVRPWQHVLDPIWGYIKLASAMIDSKRDVLNGAWNFGPRSESFLEVKDLVAHLANGLNNPLGISLEPTALDRSMPESDLLTLDSTKARHFLGWEGRLSITETLAWTSKAYRTQLSGGSLREIVERQISEYLGKSL